MIYQRYDDGDYTIRTAVPNMISAPATGIDC